MKKKQWLLALFMALSFVFASCSGLIDGIMGSNDDDDDDSSSSRTLTITVDNYADVIDTSSSTARLAKNVARTISATSFSNTDTLFFYVYGTSSDDETLTPTKVSITKEATGYTGTVSLNSLSTSVWYLTLVATQNDTTYADETAILADAVLKGRATVDLRTGTEATFTLTVDGLTKPAAIDLSISSESDWFVTGTYPKTTWTVTAGLYDRVTGAIVNDSAGDTTLKTLYDSSKDVFSSTGATGAAAKNFTIASMTAGTYLFKVTFANSSTGKSFVWSDIIIVLPGRPLTDSIKVPNIIGAPPSAAPANFYAQYASTESGTATLADTPYEGYYIVDFNWEDKSNNEKYFQIDLAEIADDDTSATTPVLFDEAKLLSTNITDEIWKGWSTTNSAGGLVKAPTSYTAETYFNSDGTSADVYYQTSGKVSSLLAGSIHAEFKLELGKRYFARICAVNDAGASSYTYVKVSEATITDTNYQKFTSNAINLFRIKYDLLGGTYYPNGADSANSISNNILKYYSRVAAVDTDSDNYKEDGGVEVLDISGGVYDTSAATHCANTSKTLVNKAGTAVYTGWYNVDKSSVYEDSTIVKSATETSKHSSVKYSGYANLNLQAGAGVTYVIQNPVDYAIQDSWVTITGTDVTPATTTATGKKGSFTVSFKRDDAASWVYDYVEITVNANDGSTYVTQKTYSVASDTAAINVIQKLGVGIYNISVVGKYGNIYNSKTITLTVSD